MGGNIVVSTLILCAEVAAGIMEMQNKIYNKNLRRVISAPFRL